MIITPKKVISYLFTLSILAAAVLAWSQRQAIYDWYQLRGYQPSNAVVKLATDTTMDDYARKVFYVNHPDIENKSEFSKNCPQAEQTIVLGCYVGNQGIYILNVKESQLNGVEQVTAAHELLHAMYDRLNGSEKNQVIKLLKTTFSKVNDRRIRKNIQSYQKADADIYNELHSILGTEVRNLPSELESYYKKYFFDRSKIVSYSQKYEKVFTELEQRAQNLENQIDKLKAAISKLEAELSAKRANLESRRGEIESQNQANQFNAQVTDYNNSVNYLNQLVKEHNIQVGKHRELVVQRQGLYKAIDSKITSL